MKRFEEVGKMENFDEMALVEQTNSEKGPRNPDTFHYSASAEILISPKDVAIHWSSQVRS